MTELWSAETSDPRMEGFVGFFSSGIIQHNRKLIALEMLYAPTRQKLLPYNKLLDRHIIINDPIRGFICMSKLEYDTIQLFVDKFCEEMAKVEHKYFYGIDPYNNSFHRIEGPAPH